MAGMLLYVFSRPVDKYWKRKAEEEWKIEKQERNGSEMYLYFIRA
jgi:squalene cyclase